MKQALCFWFLVQAVLCYSQKMENIKSPPNLPAPEYYIDVVIPACKKDQRTLDYAIAGIRKNGVGIRRIIVVSDQSYTNQAEWFDERNYPFSKNAIENIITKYVLNGKTSTDNNTGWLLQQLLKLYAVFVIPDIADNILILDADTIFLNPTSFIDKDGYALYNVGSEYYIPYFEHAIKLIPQNPIKKMFTNYSGICHHMLFQKKIMTDLFNEIQNAQGKPVWEALIANIDPTYVQSSCMSEYEIYFNYIFSRNYKVKIRELKWRNNRWYPEIIAQEHAHGLHYISCHAWMRRWLRLVLNR